MVFERRHVNCDDGRAVAPVSGIINNYNNTNASGYINLIRLKRRKYDLELEKGKVYHRDEPPAE